MAERNHRKVRIGIVSSDKMVDSPRRHPLYGKLAKNTNHFKAHDELNEAKVGDRVKIMETRPLSKTKRWRLVEILEKAPIV